MADLKIVNIPESEKIACPLPWCKSTDIYFAKEIPTELEDWHPLNGQRDVGINPDIQLHYCNECGFQADFRMIKALFLYLEEKNRDLLCKLMIKLKGKNGVYVSDSHDEASAFFDMLIKKQRKTFRV